MLRLVQAAPVPLPPLRLPPPPLSGSAPGGSRSQLEMAVAARAPQTVGWEEG